MKISNVFKVTSVDNRSYLTTFDLDDTSIKNLLGLQFSTEHWTLPPDEYLNSGIFIFLDLESAERFINQVTRRGRIWEAKAFGIRERKTIISLHYDTCFETCHNFLSGKTPHFKVYPHQERVNYHVADGVKLVKLVKTHF